MAVTDLFRLRPQAASPWTAVYTPAPYDTPWSPLTVSSLVTWRRTGRAGAAARQDNVFLFRLARSYTTLHGLSIRRASYG